MYLLGKLKFQKQGRKIETALGPEFVHEMGGEYDSRFRMSYSHPDGDLSIDVGFKIEGNEVFDWIVSPSDPTVEIVSNELEVPARFLNYDPQEDF